MRLIRLLKYDLAKEITSWVQEGLISREQAASICSRYGVDFNILNRKSVGYYVLIGLGFLFIGLSLITLISANWDEIPRALRMSGLIALTLSANLLGLLTFRQGMTNKAVAWFFLGGLFYGASIMLIAQIYHIGEHFPDGIFWWAMGVLPIGILLQSSLIMILAVGLSFIWFFVESYMNFYPTLFPLFLAASIWHLSRGGKSYVLFIAIVVGLGFWAEYTLAWLISDSISFNPGAENVVLGFGLFLVYYGLAKWLVARDEHLLADYGTLLGVWVLRFTIITLLVMSFEEPWKEFIEADWQVPRISIAMSLFLSFLAIWLARKSKSSIASILSFAIIINISLVALMLADRSNAHEFQFAYNIILVATGVWLIIRGIQGNISHYFYLGILTISITGLLRYIDLFEDYIGASIMFAVFATILLLSARFWKSRRSLNSKDMT